jgi:hypothetical protein
MGWATFWVIFFTNSSGHPGSESTVLASIFPPKFELVNFLGTSEKKTAHQTEHM